MESVIITFYSPGSLNYNYRSTIAGAYWDFTYTRPTSFPSSYYIAGWVFWLETTTPQILSTVARKGFVQKKAKWFHVLSHPTSWASLLPFRDEVAGIWSQTFDSRSLILKPLFLLLCPEILFTNSLLLWLSEIGSNIFLFTWNTEV